MEPTIPSPTHPPAQPARRLQWLAFTVRMLLWLVVSAWLLFGLSLVVLHGWIVPRIGEFRPRLEIEASKALGVPVRIGDITARSRGMIPSFELRDVTLLDPQGREALRLPRLLGALSPASIWSLGFEQLYIDEPELDIRRAADGKIYVGGLDVSQDRAAGQSAAADWFFSQTEFVIRGGTVRWTDELQKAPTLALTQVDWVMRNARRRHLMRLDASPPPEWGDRFTLMGVFRQSLLSRNAGDFDGWTGQLFADFGRVDASRVRQYINMDTLGVELIRGNGALRAWADVSKGQIIGGTADVALQDVDARLGARLQPLAFESVAGRIGGGQRANGFDFNTQGLRFRTRDGLQWPGGNVALVHTGDEAGAPQHTEFKADKLDLAALAQIANRLPLDEPTHALIASFAPKGLVETVEARWQGPMDAPSTYAAKGRVVGLNVAALPAPPQPAASGPAPAHPKPGRPGISGAAIDFDVTQAGGQAKVRIANGALTVPGVFEDPVVPFDQFSTEAQWKFSGRKIEAQLRNLQFANADAQGEAQVSWHTADVGAGAPAAAGAPDHRFPGVVDLQGALSRGDGDRVHRYLPLVLPDPVRHYVRDAVVQGQVSDVKFKVKGPVEELPFKNPARGEFRVSAKVRNGQLAYVPKTIQPAGAAPWPALTELNGELVFNRASLEVNGATSKVAGLPGLQVVKAEARIPDLTHDSTVEVNVEVKGALSDALGFVNQSPVGNMTNHVLAKAVATGTGEYRFRLGLPIHSIDKSRVEGTVTLSGNDVQFAAATPALSRLKGVVTVSERGFSVAGGQARLLGGDIRFDGGMRSQPRAPGSAETETVATFKGQGTVTAEGLRQAKELGPLSRMAQGASGSTAYTATLGFRRGQPEVAISSSLQGMALNLPAPLSKTAEAALPLRFENTLLQASLAPGQKLEDQLSITLGRIASIMYVRDVSGPEPRVIRGGIGVGLEPGETAPMQEAGVAANINLAQVDLDAWQKLLTDSSGGTALAAPPPVAATAATNRAAAVAALTYMPTVMAIRAKELVVEGRKLNNVVVGGSREGLTWRANIDATELNGYVEFRQPGGIGAGRLYARLSRLSLEPGTASDVEAILNEQPASIPALDVVVEDLELRGKKLGRVEIDAVNRGASAAAREGVREWRLNKFNVILPEAVLTATGNWVALNAQAPTAAAGGARPARAPAERRRTVMNFKLDIADSGALLRRFGMGDVIRRGKGKLEGQVAWVGSPLSLDYPTMSGQFNVNVESGQFVKADPGIAKLLGVLSLQSLPRRLALDFRDVFSEGFAFDFVRGDVNINQGVAYTNNLQMRGVNAAVLMEGSADIAKETQNIKVVVVPEINAGTASLIATAINPAIGLGSFLAQMFLRRPLMQAATQEFHIDGAWSDPRVTKLDRKAQAEAKPPEASTETR
ncbi:MULTISPECIES: YhdP family protein [unclassified Polaromonas]|uniref:YhdP family protein n=1 Tax=unclassified Polaromonas TaxID=2638319 RepID=UPI000F088ED0|nr:MULTISPECIES: YhdP family protein [unclassified Polaromonas]AYQ27950.1 TIGR02099 family protein [Polaromonas sp. SP1]QGJ17190.1 TIGR02099 family protein [Polaromonas sp. Pch-P]